MQKNRNFSTLNYTKKLVESLVLAKINFACTLYLGLPEKLFKKLQKIQNFGARIITKSPRRNHITPVLKSLNCLPVKEFSKYRLLILVYQCLNHNAPLYLSYLIHIYEPNRNLRSINKYLFTIPNLNTQLARRSSSFSAPQYWNPLPLIIKTSSSLQQFKKAVRKHIFEHIFSD